MIPETQSPTNQEPSPAGQCGSLSVVAGSPLSAAEKERERCRKKSDIYRRKYPERVKASKAKQRAKPDYNEKRNEARWSLLNKRGIVKQTPEQRAEHMRKIAREYAENETPQRRAERLANTRTPAARAALSAALLAKGPDAPAALFWSLVSPDGVAYKFKNLAAFIRENRHLFSEEQLKPVNSRGRTRIEAAIAMLSPRRKHCVEHCHGWRWNIDGQTAASYLANVRDEQRPRTESLNMNEPISMDERQMSALEKELQEQRAPSASAPAETACQPRSLALATCSGSVSRAEVERDDLSDQADECEQIALFLARIGDKKKALQRLREAEELRRQVEAIDKRQPSPNAKAEGAAEAPAAKQSP